MISISKRKKLWGKPIMCAYARTAKNKKKAYRAYIENFVRDAIREKADRENGCIWTCTDDEENLWESSECGAAWTLNSGTPHDNNMHFCPTCGKKLVDKP